MKVASGKVVLGQVAVTDPSFAEGTEVFILAREPDHDDALGADELAALEEGIAQADRGEMIPADELFEALKRFG